MTSSRLTILQLNDSHGYLDLHPELFRTGTGVECREAGGYARIATVLRQRREANPGGVLAFDCGDTLHGTYPAVTGEGEQIVPLLNALGFAAMTGHWEFAYGPDRLIELTGKLDFPLLAINCYARETGRLVFPPYRVVEAAGLRIGVIGIAATIVDKVMPASYSRGLRFSLSREELPGWIGKLRGEEKADLVVVVSHLGFPQEVQLAQEVEGIDVLLSAHTHNRVWQAVTVGRTILFQSGCHGSFLGELEAEVQDGRIVDFRHRLLTVRREIEPDPQMEERVRALRGRGGEELERVVGYTETTLDRYAVLESSMDNLLLQAIQELTGDALAFSNGWRYGAPIPAGPITLNDLWNIIPVNPPVSRCALTGQEIRRMLEENLEHTFSRDPYNQMGGYVKRCLGLRFSFKAENPTGLRIQELFIGGRPAEPEREYASTFVTEQGVPAKYGRGHNHLDVRAIDALVRYLSRHSPVRADIHGTVSLV